jgi:hypothetical protein
LFSHDALLLLSSFLTDYHKCGEKLVKCGEGSVLAIGHALLAIYALKNICYTVC